MKRALFTIGISILGFASMQAQSVSTWAGNPAGSTADGKHDKSATKMPAPWGIAKDSKGNYWVTTFQDPGQIFMIYTDSKVYSRVGNPNSPITGFQDGSATSGEVGYTTGIAIESDTIFFCDYKNNAIRKISPFKAVGQAQTVTTIAGGGGNLGSTTGLYDTTDGQGYGVKGAYFSSPSGLGINPTTHDLIVADAGNNCIRGIKRNGNSYGTSYLIAGQKQGYKHVDGPPTKGAQFLNPTGLWIDPSTGDIYVTELAQNIRKIPFNSSTKKYDKNVTSINISSTVSPTSLVVSNVQGILKGTTASGGSTFYFTNGSSVVSNDLTGSATTKLLAGNGGYTSDMTGDSSGFQDGPGKISLLNQAYGMMDISSGSNKYIIVADMGNDRIRQIDLNGKYLTGIEDQKPVANGAGFKVYPNPAADYVTLENFDITAGNNTTIGLYDMTGQVMFYAITEFDGRFSVPLNNMPKGVYVLKVQNETTNFTSKVIVNH